MPLDRNAPVPLYYQIASRLRYEIGTGALPLGARLPSLRSAAKAWDVNLHTVRKAYQELEEEGLVETEVPRGTVVVPREQGESGSPVRSFERFVDHVAREAESRFGANLSTLVQGLRGLQAKSAGGAQRVVWVVECSETLSASMAEQLRERWGVEARAWRLDRLKQIPPGLMVSTYFHHDEVTRVLRNWPWPLEFVVIHPAQALLDRIRRFREEGEGGRLVLLETDETFAHNLASDLEASLGGGVEFEIRLPADPGRSLRETDPDTLVLTSTRNWDRLSEEDRTRANVLEMTYTIDPEDLERLGELYGWQEVDTETAGEDRGDAA